MTDNKKKTFAFDSKLKDIFFKKPEEEERTEIETRAVFNIPCDLIRPNRSQPRADFNTDSLQRLAESIRKYGIIQPLSVRKSDIDDIYEYELISGERRLRAAKSLGLYSVPCTVLEVTDKISAELAIIENLMRDDLNMFELAYGLFNLYADFGLTQEEIARKMSMRQSTVANKIRLLQLSYEEQQEILENDLSERHARALLRLKTPEERKTAIYKIADQRLTVRETEEYIESLLNKNSENPKENTSELSRSRSVELPPDADKSTALAIKAFQKRVESLSKSGQIAFMEVKPKKNSIEVFISIEKRPV